MARLAIGAAVGLVVGVVLAAAIGIHAQTEPTPDVVAVADEAGVDALELQGALNSTHMEAAAYLCAADGLLCPVISPAISRGYPARVRLTQYVEYGVTYGGGHPYAGSTACSWNFALGTRFVLPDGEVFVCNDRGLLGGAPGWLDLWRRPDLARAYGPFTTVQVIP